MPQDIALAAHSVPSYLQSREIAQQFDTDPIYLAGLDLPQTKDFAAYSELIQPGSEPDAISHVNAIRQARKKIVGVGVELFDNFEELLSKSTLTLIGLAG